MKSKITVNGLIEELREHAATWEGLRSLTLHGSQAKGHELLFYTDIDVIIIFNDDMLSVGLKHVRQFFNHLCNEHSSDDAHFIYRLESGPMHPLRQRGEYEPIVPLRRRRIIFFHISVFSESFYKGAASVEPGLSSLLIYSWQNYEPLLGMPLRELRSLNHISINDLLTAGLGISDGISMLEDRRTHFWRWIDEENEKCRMFWDSAAFQDFEVFEFPLYVARWAITNSVRAFTACIPIKDDGDAIPDTFLRYVVVGEHEETVTRVFSLLANIQHLMADYSESPSEFIERHQVEDLYQKVLQLLHSIRSHFIEILKIKSREYSFSIEDRSVPVKVSYQIKDVFVDTLLTLSPDRVLLMSDENVARNYDLHGWLKQFELHIEQVTLEPGEREKSLERLLSLLFLAERMGLNNKSVVIIVGGGNVGNLGGLVAGLVCRGIPFIHVPTSLVAQLDSAIGAKQSVNGIHGKNYFGLYHPPTVVLVNPLFLGSLPRSEVQSGLVEAMKHGFCQSAELVDYVKRFMGCDWERNISLLSQIIEMTIKLKLEYMAVDPYESDPKQFLELGHKVGHALEQLCRGQYSHGFCVAFGMVAECLFFERRGECDKSIAEYVIEGVRTIYNSLELPANASPHQIARQLLFDNKRQADLVPFAYLRAPQVPVPAPIRLTDAVIDEFTCCIELASERLK